MGHYSVIDKFLHGNLDSVVRPQGPDRLDCWAQVLSLTDLICLFRLTRRWTGSVDHRAWNCNAANREYNSLEVINSE